MIYIASDHQGYKLKQSISERFIESGIKFEDLGPSEMNSDDDYPDFVAKVADKMALDETALGILICKNGVGVSMMANRYPHIRCALTWDPEHASSSKTDDNSNVLALPAHFINTKTAFEIILSWLKTPFIAEDRHTRRLNKVKSYTKNI